MKAFAYLIPLSMLLLVAGCGSDEAETAVVTSTETCHLDFINGSQERLVEITSGQLDVRGWAFDRNTMTTPENIEVILKGVDGKAFSFTGSKRGERLDVAKAYSKETIKNAGFLLKTNVPALPQGIYSISLKMSQGKKTVLCGIKKNVKFI